MFMSVVLPAPFSPSRPCTSPARSTRSTASLATTPGKRLVMPRISTVIMRSPTSGARWPWPRDWMVRLLERDRVQVAQVERPIDKALDSLVDSRLQVLIDHVFGEVFVVDD